MRKVGPETLARTNSPEGCVFSLCVDVQHTIIIPFSVSVFCIMAGTPNTSLRKMFKKVFHSKKFAQDGMVRALP